VGWPAVDFDTKKSFLQSISQLCAPIKQIKMSCR